MEKTRYGSGVPLTRVASPLLVLGDRSDACCQPLIDQVDDGTSVTDDWRASAEISAYCDLPPPVIERVISSNGAVIDRLPCSLEICHEDGCTWVGVDPYTV